MSKTAMCHKDIREVAMSAANELYDTVMCDNLVYETWKRQNPGATPKVLRSKFVARNWPKCIPFARATLAQMLTKPIDEKTKFRIMEILILDNSLSVGRASPTMVEEFKKGIYTK